ncbi:hypothetical protein LINPERPRIM_LOCUS4922 [Linum perenne]
MGMNLITFQFSSRKSSKSMLENLIVRQLLLLVRSKICARDCHLLTSPNASRTFLPTPSLPTLLSLSS